MAERIERGRLGTLPYAAIGSGPPVLVLSGLLPVAGAVGDGYLRGILAPLRGLAARRRVVVLNRRVGLAPDTTISDLAREHAAAIRADGLGPVDVFGTSTGGSIAQQLAADHPEVVDQLAVVSAACRLGPLGRRLQASVADHLRGGRARTAMSIAAGGIAPRGLRTAARVAAAAGARRLLAAPTAVTDLIATLDAEDGFDLARCERPIAAPTLIVGGRRDRFYGSALFRETARLIPGSRLLLLDDRGHLGTPSDPRAVAALDGFFG